MDYKKIVKEFCSNQRTKALQKQCKQIDKPDFYNLDLFNVDQYELSECILKLTGRSFSVQTLYIIRKIVFDFYTWAINKGYTNVNPFYLYDQLEFEVLSEKMAEKSNTLFLHPEDVNELCEYLSDSQNTACRNRPFLTFFISALYNGYEQKEFIQMKMDEIFKHNCWQNQLYNKYANNYMDGTIGVQYKEYVLRVKKNKIITDEEFRSYQNVACRNLFIKYVSEVLKENMKMDILINPSTVLYSGFLSYCRSQCSTNEEFVLLFEKTPGYKNTESVNKLKKYSDYFFVSDKVNSTDKVTKLKATCFILLRKSKWYLEYKKNK